VREQELAERLGLGDLVAFVVPALRDLLEQPPAPEPEQKPAGVLEDALLEQSSPKLREREARRVRGDAAGRPSPVRVGHERDQDAGDTGLAFFHLEGTGGRHCSLGTGRTYIRFRAPVGRVRTGAPGPFRRRA
jgi:hypothetical protein